jgi:hypothetical protein
MSVNLYRKMFSPLSAFWLLLVGLLPVLFSGPEDGCSNLLRNAGELLPNYTVSQKIVLFIDIVVRTPISNPELVCSGSK